MWSTLEGTLGRVIREPAVPPVHPDQMGYAERTLGRDEELILTLRPHVKALLRPALVLLAVGPAVGFLIGMVPDGEAATPTRLVIAAAAAAVIGNWVLGPFLAWFNTLYVLTDRRLVTRAGVFNRSGHDMPLSRLNDVRFGHNVIERVLGCGNLVVESAGEAGQITLTDVPRVEQVQRLLYRLSDDVRRVGPNRARTTGDVDDDAWDDEHDEGWDDADEPFDELLITDADGRGDQATLVLKRRHRWDEDG